MDVYEISARSGVPPAVALARTKITIDAGGNFWIIAVVAGVVEVIDRNGRPLHFLDTGGTILSCVLDFGVSLHDFGSDHFRSD